MGNSCCAPAPNDQTHNHHHQGKTPIHGRSSGGVAPPANASRNQGMPPNRGNTQSMNARHLNNLQKPLPFPVLGIAALGASHPDEQLNTTKTAENKSSQSDEPVTAVQSTNQVDEQLNITKTTENRSSPSDEPVTATQGSNQVDKQPLALKSVENKSSPSDCNFEPEVYKSMRSISLLPDLSESEDICSTCLDGYDEENPKIFTKCKHHYHLSCIYEWMERSNTCPMCDQVMIFDESS